MVANMYHRTVQKRRLVGTLMAMSIGVAACGGSGDEAAETTTPATTEAQAVTTEAEQPDTTEASETSVADTVPATDPPDGGGSDGAGTIDDPFELLDAQFEWDENGRTTWDIQLYGLVETAVRSSDEDTCAVLIGVATPTFVDGDYRTIRLDSPDVGAIVNDEYLDKGTTCDVDEIEEAGYSDFFFANALTGTPVNFFRPVLLEGLDTAAVQTVVIGEEDDDTALYFTPSLIDTIPARTPAPADLGVPETSPLVGAAITQSRIEVTLHGLIATPKPSPSLLDGEGSCLTLIGEGTPIEIDEGVYNSTGPHVRIIAGGQVLDDTLFCDNTTLDAAGYPAFTPRTTLGTAFPFRHSFFIPDYLADSVTTVMVADFHKNEFVMLEPTITDTIPPIPAAPADPVLPATQGSMTGAEFTWTNERAELSWDIKLDGLVNTGPNLGGDGTCYVATGTMSPSIETTKSQEAPGFGLIASGLLSEAKGNKCDLSAIEALGYGSGSDAKVAAGTPYPFYAAMEILDNRPSDISVFFVGNAGRDGEALFFDAALIAEVPAL